MMRISQGVVVFALAAIWQGAGLAPVAAQSFRSGIEQSPLPPPSGFGAPTAPAPGGGTSGAPVAPAPAQRSAPAPQDASPLANGGSASDVGVEGDAVVVRPPSAKIRNRYAVYAGLDKITGRTTTFDVAIGETAQFGALQVTPRVCYTRPANETQNTTSFTEVNEVTLKGEAKRIFTGWMFASSPGLHAVEHPIYDVWLIGCKAPDPVTTAGQQ